ncbi:hypothetical protein D3C81_1700510 [compost metagenome]
MSIAQFLVVDLFTGRQALLEYQPLVLIGANLGRGRVADGNEVVLMQARLLGELLAVTPVLHLPYAASRETPLEANAE